MLRKYVHTLISLINVGPTLTDFKKVHPPCLLNSYIFPPSTFIPTSTFSDLAFFAPPPRLFQPPCLLKRWEYSVWNFANFCLSSYNIMQSGSRTGILTKEIKRKRNSVCSLISGRKLGLGAKFWSSGILWLETGPTRWSRGDPELSAYQSKLWVPMGWF